jgi:hypothetical protein
VSPPILTDQDVERVARRVVDLLRSRDQEDEVELVTVAELARRFSVSTDLVYENADQLGAIRLGSRILFDPKAAADRLVELNTPDDAPPRPRSGKRKSTRTDLLEIPEDFT